MAKGGADVVDTQSTPWGPALEFIMEQMGASQDRFNDPLSFFPGQTVAGRSRDTASAYDLTRELATGNETRDSANAFIGQVVGGDFMPGNANNPYLDEVFDVMSGRIGEQFNQIVMPTINSRFGDAGRSGSSASGRARGRADETLVRELGDLGTQVYYGDYERRMGDRFEGVRAQAGLQSQELESIGALAASGADQENYTQRLLNDAIQRFDFAQNEPEGRLDRYIQRIGSASSGFGTQQQVVQPVATGDSDTSGIAGLISMIAMLVAL